MYTLQDRASLTGADLAQPIEGMREGWSDRLVANGYLNMRKNTRESRAFRSGYLTALYVLRNSFLPPTYYRSLPIARLETQLGEVLARLEQNGGGGL